MGTAHMVGSPECRAILRNQCFYLGLVSLADVGPDWDLVVGSALYERLLPLADYPMGSPKWCAEMDALLAFQKLVPLPFAVGNWNVAPTGPTSANVNVTGMPARVGMPVTEIDYTVDGGPFIPSGTTGVGNFTIPGLTSGITYSIVLYAVNVNGRSPASDAKLVLPS